VVPQCWGMSPELGSLAWQAFYSGSRCTSRRHQDRFRFGSGLGSSRNTSTSPGPCWSAWRASSSGRVGGAFYLNRTDPQSSSSFIRPGRQGDGESLGKGVSVGESLGEGDDVSLAGGSVAVDVGAGGTAVVVGNGTGGVGQGSVAGGGSDPSFPAPVVGIVAITGAYRLVKACGRASPCNH
jgi:hypothetical protein